MSWTNRLLNAFRKHDLNREIDEELLFHLEARDRDHLVAGMTELRLTAALSLRLIRKMVRSASAGFMSLRIGWLHSTHNRCWDGVFCPMRNSQAEGTQ